MGPGLDCETRKRVGGGQAQGVPAPTSAEAGPDRGQWSSLQQPEGRACEMWLSNSHKVASGEDPSCRSLSTKPRAC